MTEEAPAGSSEGATWALRHRKALASALFVLAAIAALKAPGLRITALFVFLLGASLLIAEGARDVDYRYRFLPVRSALSSDLCLGCLSFWERFLLTNKKSSSLFLCCANKTATQSTYGEMSLTLPGRRRDRVGLRRLQPRVRLGRSVHQPATTPTTIPPCPRQAQGIYKSMLS